MGPQNTLPVKSEDCDFEKPLAKSTRRRKTGESRVTSKRARESPQTKESPELSSPTKRRAPTSPGSPSDTLDDPKRQNKLERNRVAATKCRQRNKKQEKKLVEKCRALEAERGDLLTENGALQYEVLTLKNEILKHGFCDCEFIQRYIADSARHVVREPPGDEQRSF